MMNQAPVMRRDINVDYEQQSGTWGVRLYAINIVGQFKPGQFVSWGAKSPEDCKNLPYYHYPLEENDDEGIL